MEWCTVADVRGLLSDSTVTDEMITDYIVSASSVLFHLTGGRFRERLDGAQILKRVNHRGVIRIGDWAPIRAVHGVSIGGTVLTTDEYTVAPARSFVSVGTTYQLQTAKVTADIGSGIPPAAANAAANLAASFARSDSRYSQEAVDARPTTGITSIARQGITYTYADPSEMIKSGFTGIPNIDLYIRSVNPNGSAYQSRTKIVEDPNVR